MHRFLSVILLCAVSVGAVIADDKPVSIKQLSALGMLPGPSGSEGTVASRQALADAIGALFDSPPGIAPVAPPVVAIDPGEWAKTLLQALGGGSADGSTPSGLDMAALTILGTLYDSASQPDQLSSPDAFRALLLRVGLAEDEAQNLAALKDMSQAKREALLAKVMAVTVERLTGTPPNEAAPAKPLAAIEEVNLAAAAAQRALQAQQEVLKLKQAQLEAERAKKANAEAALKNKLAEQNRQALEKLKQQMEAQLAAKKAQEALALAQQLELALAKQAATGQAKQLADLTKAGPPTPGPQSPWPAWMGQNAAYAPVYGNVVSTGAGNGAFATYEGEARGSDSLGNQTTGAFYSQFALDNGIVYVEGVLLGLHFGGDITNPAVNRFDATFAGGTSHVTAGADGRYSGGSLDGRFYGGGHEAVGGAFSLTGDAGTSDMNGHFVGVMAP